MLKFTGYHGTTADRATSIEKMNEFNFSTKPKEWLGKGVYFFSEVEHAVDWAKTEVNKPTNSNKPYCRPATVLIVKISSEESKYIDFDDTSQMRRLECFINVIIGEMKKSGSAFPDFKDTHEQRCYYCNLYKEAVSAKVLSYSFPKIRNNILGFQVEEKQKQYCVSDHSCIKIIERKEYEDAV